MLGLGLEFWLGTDLCELRFIFCFVPPLYFDTDVVDPKPRSKANTKETPPFALVTRITILQDKC